MSTPTKTPWTYMETRPTSAYRQLFVKHTRIMARILYGMYMSEEEPRTAEDIPAAFCLPLEAVHEAIAYCSTNPPEIQDDWEHEEARDRARTASAAAGASVQQREGQTEG